MKLKQDNSEKMKEPTGNEGLENASVSTKRKRAFSIKFLFDRNTLSSDMAAGLTLGIESIPDAMASALLAVVNPIHGLYAVLFATPVGALFASSAVMSVQTTSAMSLVVASVPQVHEGEQATLALFALAILTGIFMLILGLLKLGSLLRFVPNSVMAGFINGIAVLIILGQLGDFTGYHSDASNKVTQTIDLLFNLNQIDPHTLAVGTATILLILLLEKTAIKKFALIVALLVASLLVPLFNWESVQLVNDIADIPNSLPRPVLPPLSVFIGLLIPALSLAFVGLVQGAGVSQNYVNPDGEYPDASGDFVGQGVANVAAGLFQGMPVGGSLSATSLVVNSGARTRMGNIAAGVTIAIALLLFADVISALAMPALAGLLIVIGFRTLKPDEVHTVWKTGAVQQAVMVITFVATLLIPLQFAVLFGVALAFLLFVISQSNKVTIKEWTMVQGGRFTETDAPETLPANQVTVLRPYGSLFFAAASVFEDQLPEITDETRFAVVILNMHGRTDLGSTFLGALEKYAENMQTSDNRLMLSGVTRNVKQQLEMTGQIETFGRDNIFESTEFLGESTREAYYEAQKRIKRAQRQHPVEEAESPDIDEDEDA